MNLDKSFIFFFSYLANVLTARAKCLAKIRRRSGIVNHAFQNLSQFLRNSIIVRYKAKIVHGNITPLLWQWMLNNLFSDEQKPRGNNNIKLQKDAKNVMDWIFESLIGSISLLFIFSDLATPKITVIRTTQLQEPNIFPLTRSRAKNVLITFRTLDEMFLNLISTEPSFKSSNDTRDFFPQFPFHFWHVIKSFWLERLLWC